jgi:MFS family permease
MTLNFLAMGAAGFGWGALSDRIGPRPVVLAGAILLGLGLFLASRAQSVLAFQLSFGLLVGIAVGSFFSPMIAAVMGWISERRGLAVALVSVGVGVAPVTMSPFAAWLITQMDWRQRPGRHRRAGVGDARSGCAFRAPAARRAGSGARRRRRSADEAARRVPLGAVHRACASPSSPAARRTPARSSTPSPMR